MQGAGIQNLLSAEAEAGKIVAEARKAKQERLRQAKAEAEREIAAYRAEREGGYQKKLSETTSGAAATSDRLHKETEQAIKQVQSDVAASKGSVVDMLVRYATTVA
ncbi:V-type proton ATPase subunit G 2 [Monoraphidium neglectum]|uniref:V-type proton ATPase subunit G n=1 Tax=Monoraphidium neglectum TaxID=145388 RepID=A0A0D2MGG7_9CHLO|nr:V-type proton ATPase subunit G 2 [Monoraphidium neglectum]KIY99836.1 V-type proton ATPase subunit G 2 [Monoraphidium neglectum]|eukprot:XP_013898856.1 V-type proton ATPase subunit G 2 [Monoraphidium neglectum]